MILRVNILLIFQLLIGIDISLQTVPTTLPPGPTPTPGIVWQPCTKFTDTRYSWLQFSDGGNVNSDYCYYFSATYSMVSWHAANDRCRVMNGTLASVHDFTTNYLLSHRNTTAQESGYEYFWIGLNSLTQRGIYKWSDNSAVPYMNYANVTSRGDLIPPSPLDQGRCITLKSRSKSSYSTNNNVSLWFKDDCIAGNRYICQRSGVSGTIPTQAPPPVGNCPPDWFQYANQKCIKYINGNMTFNQSRDTCIKNNGGEMLSIHSEEEQNFITAYTAGLPPPYIGLKRGSDYRWNWDDSKATDFTNWGVNSYNYYLKKCGIVISNNNQAIGKWSQENCSLSHSVVCEKPLNASISTPGMTYAQNKCKIPGFENFHQFGNSCYSLVESDPSQFSNFTDAENNCQSLNGSHLLSIVSPIEEAFLRYYITQYGKSDMYWIGLQSKLNGDQNVSQAFEWTDEWPVYYTNWDKYEPQFAGLPQEECVTFAKANGTWRTTMCDSNFGHICKVTTNKLPKMNSDKSGVCPQLFNVTEKSLQWVDIDKRQPYCYWFSVDRKGTRYAGYQSWVDAAFHCRQRNGTLASIHSNHDLLLLRSKFMQSGTSYNTWIGLSSDPNGDYIWEDGSGLQYTNWDPNEKIVTKTDSINDDARRQCVEVKSLDLMWRQSPCSGSNRQFYACEVKKIYHGNPNKPTQSPNNISNKQKSSNAGISGGAKAGIAFGVIGGVVVLLAVGYFGFKRYRPNSPAIASFENRLYASRRGQPNN